VLAAAYYMMSCGCENQTKYVIERPVVLCGSLRGTECSQKAQELFQVILELVHDLPFEPMIP
jgi:hypothetical protein